MSAPPAAQAIIDAVIAAALAFAVPSAAFACGAPQVPAATIEAAGPDKIVMGEPPVLMTDAVSTAIDMIKASGFGKSPEGQKVIAKLEALDAARKIQFMPVLSNPSCRGE